MHPVDAIFHWARHYPRRLAVLLPHMAITYHAMAEAIDAVSEHIDRIGFDPREPVAVAIGDPGKFLAVCFALLRRGIACAPVGGNSFPHLQSNGINTLIFLEARDVLAGGRNIRFDDSWLTRRSASTSLAAVANEVSESFGDLIFFTSGTTGVPKKVKVSPDALIERVNLATVTGETIHRRILVLAGLGSVFGFNRAVPVLFAGKTVCFAYGPEEQLRFINSFGVEVVIASVQQASDILNVVETGAKYRSGSLKEVWVSGGFASDELMTRLQRALCRNVINVYGSSESGFVASASYDMISHVPQAVGFVVPDMEVEIVDSGGVSMPIGQEGLVRGRSRFISKIFAANHPDKSSEAADAWWYPGDLGYLTEDGILCIAGRPDDVINMGGVKVAGSLLDEVAKGLPGVRDAGACGVRDASGIEELWIGVVAGDGFDVASFRRGVEESQGNQFRIGEVVELEKIPRNDLGKIQRHQLKALLLGLKNRELSNPR